MKNFEQTENQSKALTVEETGIESTARLDWYRPPINRKVLAELNKKNNWRPLIHHLGQLGLSVATGALALWAFHNLAWYWVVAAVYFHCSLYGFFGGGTGGHELSHRNMFKTKWLNELFIRLNGFLTWFNFIHFRHSHAKHHQYTTHHGLDGEVELPADMSLKHWIYSFTFNYEGFKKHYVMIFRQAFGRRREVVLQSEWEQRIFPSSEPKEIRKLVNWSRFLVIGHAVLALAFILLSLVIPGLWLLLFLVTFPVFLAKWLFTLTHAPQHLGMEPDVADWRHGTRTYLAGPIVNFLYWNMNYHVEHHMFAAVPFYNLPKLRKVLEADLPIATKGLLATWLEIIDTLRKQKKDPTYYRPLKFPDKASGLFSSKKSCEKGSTIII